MRRASTRRLFHNIDEVFCANDVYDTNRKEPNSIKKLKKGDACFSTVKKILGWLVDSASQTLHITATRRTKIYDILTDLDGKHRTTAKKWYRLLGTLHSLAPGLPGGRGLFSVLQHAMPSGHSRVLG